MGKKISLRGTKIPTYGTFFPTRSNLQLQTGAALKAKDRRCFLPFLTQKAQKKPDFKGKSDFV